MAECEILEILPATDKFVTHLHAQPWSCGWPQTKDGRDPVPDRRAAYRPTGAGLRDCGRAAVSNCFERAQ